MLNLVSQNPFRILGVLSNTPLKEVVGNQNRFAAFVRVGREISVPNDFSEIIAEKPIRTTDSISSANTAINLDVDKLKYALFWFICASPIDKIALEHLQTGNIEKAREIILKKETFSSLINSAVLAFIQGDIPTGFAKTSKVIHDKTLTADLFKALGIQLKMTEDEIVAMYIDELLKEVPAPILLGMVSNPDDKSIISKRAIDEPLTEITSAIATAKSANTSNPDESLAAGTKLMNSTKVPLQQIKEIAGANSSQYQMAADSLAKQILQCGINYYNSASEDDVESPRKAMVLQEYALKIAVGKLTKDRCQENYDILKKAVDNMPPASVVKETALVRAELEKFSNLSDKIEHSVELLTSTKPILQTIKSKVGATNSFYIKLSTLVVSNALHNIIVEINEAQQYDPAKERELMRQMRQAQRERERRDNPDSYLYGYFPSSDLLDEYDELSGVLSGRSSFYDRYTSDNQKKYERIMSTARKAWKAVLLTYGMDMENSYRNEHYNPNVKTLRGICEQLKIDTLSDEEREEKKVIRFKSNLLFILVAIIFLIISMIISVATDNEFWVGPLILLIPLPIPVIVASGAAVLYLNSAAL